MNTHHGFVLCPQRPPPPHPNQILFTSTTVTDYINIFSWIISVLPKLVPINVRGQVYTLLPNKVLSWFSMACIL